MASARGAGTPPSLIVIQSKREFISLVSEPVEVGKLSLSATDAAIRHISRTIKAFVVTGIPTKSRINFSSSATMEVSKKDGGATEALRQLLLFEPAKFKFDLETLRPLKGERNFST
jgi:hypothetical protein